MIEQTFIVFVMIDARSYCTFFVCFCCIVFAATLEFIPKSREIEAIDNGEYIFGLIENDNSTNITRILFSTDTDIKGEFNVEKHSTSYNNIPNDNKINSKRNQITNYGKLGKCQLKVKYADNTGPNTWTLVPYQNAQHLDEVTFKVNFFYKSSVLMEDVAVVEGASFLQYLTLLDKQWKTCILKIGDVKIELDLSSTGTYIFLSSLDESNEDISKRVKSLGRGLCGFQLVNSTLSLPTINQWSLIASDNTGNSYGSFFKVVVTEKPNTSIVKKVIVGDWTTWTCGTETTEQSYCALYNPAGKLVQDGRTCTYSTTTVTMDDIGKWMCVTGIRKSMETVDYTVDVINKGTEVIETWVKEDNKYIKLGCKLKNSHFRSLSFCRMVTPNNKALNLVLGGATGRYVSLGTNLTESVCAIEIEKPLQANENGLWKCEMSAGVTDVTGGFLKVGEVKLPDYPKSEKITTMLKKEFTIVCEVPYSSEYCHIRAPNGSTYPTESAYRTRLGHCSFTIKEASISDHGIWHCSFAREMGTPDEEIAVEVTIAEVLVYYADVEVRAGDDAVLMCSSGGVPLNYCRFISPSGKAYYVHDHQTSTSISYKGKGLEYGECGISINGVQTSDSGIWTCVTRIGVHYVQPEITAEIHLDVSPKYFEDPNVAAAIGLSVGIVIVSTITGLIIFRKWRQRRNRQDNSPQTRLINDGDSVTLRLNDPTNPPLSSGPQESHQHQP